ncbi:unnamed protein product [Alopecurus aequalis]
MADQRNVCAAIVAKSEERCFVFKIHGYSRLKCLFKNGECMASSPFSVEGHNWVLSYIGVLDKDGLKASYFGSTFETNIFVEPSSNEASYLGLHINREILERSGDIIDDSLSIKFDLILKKDIHSEETTIGNQFVAVPPTNLHQHFSNLLESMDGADVTFHVGGENILAHRIVLAARSSVFKAELLGAMKENISSPIEIHEMEADVFKSLIHFIYTDSLSVLQMACNQGEARPDVVLAGHLLVAADRYNIERLKLICEHKLCSYIDANMVATSLALAEQHRCNGLKEACLQFLASPSNLEAMMVSDGYQHLKSSCPSALRELIIRLLPVELKAARDIVMAI